MFMLHIFISMCEFVFIWYLTMILHFDENQILRPYLCNHFTSEFKMSGFILTNSNYIGQLKNISYQGV